MPLVGWEDLQRPAVSDPNRRVWELVAERVHDPERPMPPTGVMAPTDVTALDAWAAAGALAGESVCDGATGKPDDAAQSGPASLSCRPDVSVLAFGDGPDERYRIPADQVNHNACFAIRAPWQGDRQVIGMAPVLDDERFVHHIILFATQSPQPEGPFPCDGNLPADAVGIGGWAPGATNLELPPDVGLDVGGDEVWLVLQIHYWNGVGATDALDRSGMALCTTAEPRAQRASVTALGTLNIFVPPRAAATASGRCTPRMQQPVHVLGLTPHMHRSGRTIETIVHRAGGAGRETLLRVDPWDFDRQIQHPSDAVLMPGDVLETTCTWENASSRRIYFGEGTEDEMCFQFVLAYPAGELHNGGLAGDRACID
ncbi:MAG: hypothetical protein IT379_36540 [Deltaproteobacteria bacterium]|nr:hypothetical protein [Deltaproteobacteria bacterium]